MIQIKRFKCNSIKLIDFNQEQLEVMLISERKSSRCCDKHISDIKIIGHYFVNKKVKYAYVLLTLPFPIIVDFH